MSSGVVVDASGFLDGDLVRDAWAMDLQSDLSSSPILTVGEDQGFVMSHHGVVRDDQAVGTAKVQVSGPFALHDSRDIEPDLLGCRVIRPIDYHQKVERILGIFLGRCHEPMFD